MICKGVIYLKGKKHKLVIALAYFHRYGFFVIALALVLIFHSVYFYVLSSALIAYSVWSFIGYKFRWSHIFCSYQNAYHSRMTPDKIDWKIVKKSDAYGVPIIFFILGILLLLVSIFC